MSRNDHPYANLRKARFWKAAVADIDPLEIDLEWRPKFAVNRETAIITAGSCFAQHISKALARSGFKWVDSEPAPAELPQDKHGDHGYGIFSFRTGNIYTAALLKQWLFWATGRATPSEEVFVEDGRYFDPFRPTVPAPGFASAGELFEARSRTLEAIAEAVRQGDLFVFTLGLTEAWRNTEGFVYPMCPGTTRGEFSASRHVFHNFSQPEVLQDLTEVFDHLGSLNPRIRFLLTVSPVPLTATAAGQHVLTATTYSKSVLRAAAGQLAQTREDVDYFPSYELIASPVFQGRFFAPNKRSVTDEGVDFVMRQFLGAVGADNKVPAANRVVPTPDSSETGGTKAAAKDICEEIILETWSPQTKPASAVGSDSPRLLLVGDSQMGMLASALESQGIPHWGGGIMHATQWHGLEFVSLSHPPFFVPTPEEARGRWESAWDAFLAAAPSDQLEPGWIVTNVGTHTRVLFAGLKDFMKVMYHLPRKLEFPPDFQLGIEDLRKYLHYTRNPHLALAHRLVGAGYKVLYVSDPPTLPVDPVLGGALDALLETSFTAIGCRVLPVRQWIRRIGGFPPEFRSREIDPDTGAFDLQHGSPEYYRGLSKEVMAIISEGAPGPR